MQGGVLTVGGSPNAGRGLRRGQRARGAGTAHRGRSLGRGRSEEEELRATTKGTSRGGSVGVMGGF